MRPAALNSRFSTFASRTRSLSLRAERRWERNWERRGTAHDSCARGTAYVHEGQGMTRGDSRSTRGGGRGTGDEGQCALYHHDICVCVQRGYALCTTATVGMPGQLERRRPGTGTSTSTGTGSRKRTCAHPTCTRGPRERRCRTHPTLYHSLLQQTTYIPAERSRYAPRTRGRGPGDRPLSIW